jgi:hypothetical protein
MKRLNDWLDEKLGSGIMWIGERYLALFSLMLVIAAVAIVVKALA